MITGSFKMLIKTFMRLIKAVLTGMILIDLQKAFGTINHDMFKEFIPVTIKLSPSFLFLNKG